MIPLLLREDGLPLATLHLRHAGKALELPNTLIDTGSAGTVLAAEHAQTMGLQYQPRDVVYQIFGIGGDEIVYEKCVDGLALGDLAVANFPLQISAMEFCNGLDAIIGMDFLSQVSARIDLAHLCIDSAAAPGL